MAKGPNKGKKGKGDPTVDLYKLKPQAVEDLVTADESNSPQVTKAELAKYGGRKRHGVPGLLKVGFIKWWFPGSVYYFIGMGFGWAKGSEALLALSIGIALGVISDLLTDNVIRFIAPTDGEYDVFLMFPKKGYITFVLNIPYAIILCFLVLYGYYSVAISVLPWLGVEPISFGLFYMVSDMALVGIKYLIKKAIRGSQNKNEQEG